MISKDWPGRSSVETGKGFPDEFCLVWASVTHMPPGFSVYPALAVILVHPAKLWSWGAATHHNVQWVPFTVVFFCSSFSISFLKHPKIWGLFFFFPFQWSCTQLSLSFSLELMSSLHHPPSIFPCSVCSFPRGCKFHLPLILLIHHARLGGKKVKPWGNVDLTTGLVSTDLS